MCVCACVWCGGGGVCVCVGGNMGIVLSMKAERLPWPSLTSKCTHSKSSFPPLSSILLSLLLCVGQADSSEQELQGFDKKI